MRFITAVSVAFAALAGVVSAQASTGSAAPPASTGGTTMGGNAITSPIASDTIVAGEDYSITWTNTVGSTVTLVLMDGPTNQLKPVATIVASVDNTGAYTWSVPDDLPASNTYAIRISYDSNPNNYNYSDRFTFDSDVPAGTTNTRTTAAPSSTTAAPTSTETSTESETTTESETSTTTSATTETETSSTIKTSTTKKPTTTSDKPSATETSEGAPTNAANSKLSSPGAIFMAAFAAAIFIH